MNALRCRTWRSVCGATSAAGADVPDPCAAAMRGSQALNATATHAARSTPLYPSLSDIPHSLINRARVTRRVRLQKRPSTPAPRVNTAISPHFQRVRLYSYSLYPDINRLDAALSKPCTHFKEPGSLPECAGLQAFMP